MGTQAGSPLSGKNGWLKIHGANPRRTVYECLAYRYLDDFIRQNPLPTEVGVGLGEKKIIMRPRELFFAGARTLQPLTAERHSVSASLCVQHKEVRLDWISMITIVARALSVFPQCAVLRGTLTVRQIHINTVSHDHQGTYTRGYGCK
ncbi:hypothetical protein P692DRAFT_20836697 [Suillus brevipes Sb2]|nr:hypothetical protein P692DRAFT_20836697 [Suillus brevipes Sb2]